MNLDFLKGKYKIWKEKSHSQNQTKHINTNLGVGRDYEYY